MLRPRCVRLRRKPALTPHRHERTHARGATLVTLAIESSCDDTAVAVLSHTRRRTELLFNERICSDSRAFKGVHPVVAVQGHNASLAPLVQRALLALPDVESSSSSSSSSPSSASSPPHICIASSHGTLRKRRPDFVSVTRGPGLTANLAVGLNMAKGLAVAWDVPLVGVHHMQAHALTPRLVAALQTHDDDTTRAVDDGTTAASRVTPRFPFLTLLVSGGHTQLVHSTSLTDHHILATTSDVAIGNLLDQTARVILPPDILASSPDVMYGRLLEPFAFDNDGHPSDRYRDFFQTALTRQDEINTPLPTTYSWTIPLPLRNTRRLAYSFSSIHTHVHRIAETIPPTDIPQRRCLARHTLRAAFQHLASRLVLALQDLPDLLPSPEAASASPAPAPITLVISGGVASNQFLMHVLRETLSARGFPHVHILAPPVALCTDNAAMIAWTAMEMFERGWSSDLSIRPVGKWPMSVDGGDAILGMDGWVKG
ncbi:hypothetical protein E4U21_002180 [Claviceps maximensis]|nr:hypothetical protein E4U21_002180 [Claviceps maximensis]